jgi:GntR family transcriptional regulator
MCYSTRVIPFRWSPQAGVPIYQQVVYAAKRALISGQIMPGDRFPSVRALSQSLKINPNTAHKVINQLVSEGLLEVYPGVGTLAAKLPGSSARERSQLLRDELEGLVVDAIKLKLELDDVLQAVTEHWERLSSRSRAQELSGQRKG